MTYIIVIVFLLLIFLLAYRFFNKDFLSPTIISTISFVFSFVCAMIGMFSWNFVKKIDVTTILIFIIGIIAFFAGEILSRKIFFSMQKEKNKKEKTKNIYHIPRIILILLLFFVIVTTVLLIYEVIRVCNSYGFTGGSFTKILAFYRTKSGLFSSEAYTSSIKINFFVGQMQKACNAINIIVFVYAINKIFASKSINKINGLIIFFTIIICLFQTILFNGGRSIMFHYIVGYLGIFVFYYFLVYRKKFNKKVFIISFITLFSMIAIYYIMLPLVGRNTKHNFIKYNTFSFGTSIPSLNLYIQEDNSHSKLFGEKTFTGVYYTLNKFGIIDYTKPQTHEWYSFADDGTLSSNTFTSLRSYYKDFGMIGVFILQFIFGLVITFLYLKVRYSDMQILHIIYFNYFYILIEQIRDEQFFSLINVSNVANILIIIIIFQLLVFFQRRRSKNG